jgi:amino acid transporter
MDSPAAPPQLQRHFGLVHAVALNVSQIVGAGVFITIPLMIKELPGPYALLGWLAAGALMLVDGMIRSELGATLPGSGGSYVYLLECYGRERWGRLMAFLFVWQFLISGPLEIASGFIAMAVFISNLPGWLDFNAQHVLLEWKFWPGTELGITVDPIRLVIFGLGVLTLFLLYRRMATLGRWTVAISVGVLLAILWVLIDGLAFGSVAMFRDGLGVSSERPRDFATALGKTMVLAMYSYLGYYNVCYIGDEVRDPGRTLPRAILFSSLLVLVLFVAMHVAFLSVVPWDSIPIHDDDALKYYSLPEEFMKLLHGRWAVALVTLLLVWSCTGSAFAGLLGYSRIPYGAARRGHFFAALATVHPVHHIPHVSLLFVGGLTLFWSFFDLQSVIDILLVTRILEQFIGQIFGVMLLRRLQPDRPRPYRIWLYPLPCFLALAGWVYMYVTQEWLNITIGLVTLLAGAGVYLFWSARTKTWPLSSP